MPEGWLRETGSQQSEAVFGEGSDAPPLAYTWNGPVSATKDAGWAQLHPALSLGLFMQWVFFTVKVRAREREPLECQGLAAC